MKFLSVIGYLMLILSLFSLCIFVLLPLVFQTSEGLSQTDIETMKTVSLCLLAPFIGGVTLISLGILKNINAKKRTRKNDLRRAKGMKEKERKIEEILDKWGD